MRENIEMTECKEWLVVSTDRCTHFFPRDMFKESKYEILDIFCSAETDILDLYCLHGYGIRLGSYGSGISGWHVFETELEAQNFLIEQGLEQP